MLEESDLADKATRDMLALFWKAIVLSAKKALSYF